MEIFPFSFEPVFRPVLLGLGVHPGNSLVTLTDDDRFVAQFGRWRVDTPIANIDCIEISGPYRFYRAIGVRGSAVDYGLTFGSTTDGGVCVTFHEPIPRVIPSRREHPGLTVTVADREGLVAALEARLAG
jgi:hypothetical protein